MNKISRLTLFFLFIVCLLRGGEISAQTNKNKTHVGKPVQLSGLVITEEAGQMTPVPYAYVWIPRRKVGVTANGNGFFSIVAETNETVEFSALGFEKSNLVVPDTMHDDRYSMVKILSRDTILLPEAVIFPWPNRDRFKTEFLAMDVNNELERRATENLAQETLEKVRRVTPYSGAETGSLYLRQQAKTYYYYGQMPPMTIFSPQAWQDFFKAWKNGDFKKKSN